ncbi:MAG: MerR family transcriptional regulator [bacterium]
MKNRFHTVGQVAAMAGVGVKTLHHYHAIGLLVPSGLSARGYRLYGRDDLERLQAILLYRELGFSLKTIRNLMSRPGDRLALLQDQRREIRARHARLARIEALLERMIAGAATGETMTDDALFTDLATAAQWTTALQAQAEHLKNTYGAKLQAVTDVPKMNASAREAALFMRTMAMALNGRKPASDPEVQAAVRSHLDFVTAQGQPMDAGAFARQTAFFLQDSFHRDMLEGQQIGLSYYLHAVALAAA